MNDAPRRRRRVEQPRRAQNSQFPFFPLAVVIVLVGGFAIGAFFSHHRSSDETVAKTSTTRPDIVSSHPSPASAQPTRGVAAVPPEKPPSASPAPLATAQNAASPDLATATPRGAYETSAPPAVPPTIAATIPPPSTPAPARPHPVPVPSGHRALSSTPQPPTRGTGAVPVLSGGPDHVVRAYLTALIHGDERTANTALGRGPDSGESFPEQDFIDAKARITSLHATARGDGGYTVETEVAGTRGLYFVTFQVNKTPDGYVIGDHSYIKP